MKRKTLALLSVILGLYAGGISAEAGDPYIGRADIIYDAASALTPHLLHASNGDLIAGWSTAGDGWPGQATKFARSADQGITWSAPYTTIQSNQPLTGCATNLYNLPNGNILCSTLDIVWPSQPPEDFMSPEYGIVASGRKFDSYYSFSTDDGLTFTEKTRLSDPVNRNDFAQGGITKAANGDLLWSWGKWGSSPVNGFKRSTDGGLTWGPLVRAFQDPPPGQGSALAFNETAVTVGKDGTIVAVARVDTRIDKKLWQIESTDNGYTWTTPHQIETAGIAGGSPAMYTTAQGQMLLAYRDAGLGPGVGLAISDNNGQDWRYLYHLKDPTGTYESNWADDRYTEADLQQQWRPNEGIAGYPNFTGISDSKVVVAFHTQSLNIPDVGAGMIVVGNLLRIPSSILFDSFNTTGSLAGINDQLGSPRQSGSSISSGGVGYTFRPSANGPTSTAAIADGQLLITSTVTAPVGTVGAGVQSVWLNADQHVLSGGEYNVGADFHFQSNSGQSNSVCWGILALNDIVSDQYYNDIDVELLLGPTGRWSLLQGMNPDGSPIISASGALAESADYSVMLAFDETGVIKTVDVIIDGKTVASDVVFTPGGNGRYVGLRYLGYSNATYQMAFDNFVIDNLGIDPIPEPSAVVLSATGLIGLLAYAWRKQNLRRRVVSERP